MNANKEDTDITLSLLQSVAERSNVTQRGLAKRLNLALGLTNTYLKRCIKEGLIKVEQIPANRYLYSLTPKGFACKSKLLARYLNSSLRIFREARHEVLFFFEYCFEKGWSKIALIGDNDLAEITCLIAKNNNIELTIVSAVEEIQPTFDAWIISDTKQAQLAYDTLIESYEQDRILVFSLLGVVQKERVSI
jgi:DNA-binding MarR family transcriptional regulator